MVIPKYNTVAFQLPSRLSIVITCERTHNLLCGRTEDSLEFSYHEHPNRRLA